MGGEDLDMGLIGIRQTQRHSAAKRPPHNPDTLAVHVGPFTNPLRSFQYYRYVVIRRGAIMAVPEDTGLDVHDERPYTCAQQV